MTTPRTLVRPARLDPLRSTALLGAALSLLAVSPALAQKAKPVEGVWSAQCAACHGEKGEGTSAGATPTKSLLTDDLWQARFDRPFFDAIKNGVSGKSPDAHAFGASMSNEQAWALVNRIRELQATARRERVGSISKKLDKDGFSTTRHATFKIATILGKDAGLETPWSIEFMPEGRMLVTNRPGFITVYGPDRTPEGRVANLPASFEQGQGGLMDVTLHPRFGKDAGQDWVYLAYNEQDKQDGKSLGMTKIVRGHIRKGDAGWAWSDQQTIFEARRGHALPGGVHFGCKIVFDPKDADILYFGIGERGHQEMAQDLTRPNGKVHRVHADGRIPKDNPFVDRAEGTYASIWSYGHRNPQGLVFDLAGRLWDTEHAPRGGDELNLIRRGKNYGWPLVSFGINYNGTPFRTPWVDASKVDEEIEMPVDRWMPSIAACGLEVVRSEKFKGWRGDLLAGGLAGNNVDRVRVAEKDGVLVVVEREEVVHGLGRVRDIVEALDGCIYIVLNGPDRVVRLEAKPVE